MHYQCLGYGLPSNARSELRHVSKNIWESYWESYHNHTNAASLRGIDSVLSIDTAGYWSCTVIIQIVMQLAVSGAEPLLLEEERVVE